jgi:hypothetical protein
MDGRDLVNWRICRQWHSVGLRVETSVHHLNFVERSSL